jgi:hypothetical protein
LRTRSDEGLIEILENDNSVSALQVLAMIYAKRGQVKEAQAKVAEAYSRFPSLEGVSKDVLKAKMTRILSFK